ncbi:breakpoint cluster region [Brachionus plicatilis]|uniref:Breakpoint cluster region n=1 Tax=Brachionus plicatilis TaxID=10195 RepID=A0A3M7T289_BRAPC|nr:breakpoint cluster region [Brachionus plicatilis]
MSHNQSKNININNVIMSPASPYTSSQHQITKLMTSSPVNNASMRQPSLINQITVRSSAPKTNRHTIAIPNDSCDLLYQRQPSFESSSNNNSSPLSKTPDSTNENWMSISENLPFYKTILSADLTESSGNLVDSDHEMLEASGTGLSGGGGEESADDDLDSGYHNASGPTHPFHDDFDDNTTKRLKTFVATTLHNEKLYLDKLRRLLDFKDYLDDNFSGSQTDISVLFSGIQQIYTTHDIVAQKLHDYLTTLNELLQSSSKTSPANTKLNQVVGSSRQATNLSPTSPYPTNSMFYLKESFLTNALNLLANIMEISFPVYLEFLKNYPKSMTILSKLDHSKSVSKRKTLTECQAEFNKLLSSEAKNFKRPGLLSRFTQKSASAKKDPYDLYYNDAKSEQLFDLTKIFTEDILRRPTKLFEFIYSLKEECILASNDLPNSYCASLKSNIKSLFENEASKNLRELVFNEINRNIMPKEVRKNEDVIELIENSNERKLRHLVLFGDCLVCCRLKKDRRQLKWFIPIDQLEIFTDEYKSAKSENELRHLREEVVSLRGNLKKQTEENASARNQQKIKKKLAEQENELAIQSSRLKLIVRANPMLCSSFASNSSSNSSSSLGAGGFSGSLVAALSSSMNNLANLTTSGLAGGKNNSHHHHHHHHLQHHQHHTSMGSHPTSTSPIQNLSNTHEFLFTSDFERNAWLEEINGAVYAF